MHNNHKRLNVFAGLVQWRSKGGGGERTVKKYSGGRGKKM